MRKAQMNGVGSTPDTKVIIANDSRISCNGGGGPLGHRKFGLAWW